MKRLMKRVGMDNREKKVKREHNVVGGISSSSSPHQAYPNNNNNNTRRRTSSSSSNQQQQGNNIRLSNNGNSSNNNIIQHEEHGIEVNIYTKKSIPNGEWKKAEHTFLNNHNEQVTGKVLMACHVADFDHQLNSNLDSSVAMAFEINNTSSRIIRAQIYFDQQHIINFIINPYTCEFIRNISNNGSAYPLLIKQHALAQDESEIDHNFLSVMGSIKIIIHEVKNYYETNEKKEKVLERRFTCVKAGSLKSSSMSIDFGQPIPEENNARLVAQLTREEPLVEFDIKYRNKTGYLLLLVQADKLPARGRNVPEVIEVSDDDIL